MGGTIIAWRRSVRSRRTGRPVVMMAVTLIPPHGRVDIPQSPPCLGALHSNRTEFQAERSTASRRRTIVVIQRLLMMMMMPAARARWD